MRCGVTAEPLMPVRVERPLGLPQIEFRIPVRASVRRIVPCDRCGLWVEWLDHAGFAYFDDACCHRSGIPAAQTDPDRVRSVDVGFGRVSTASGICPVATAQRCTATTYVEVDPFGRTRHRRERRAQGLEPYVNDRPYAASSMLSVALAGCSARR